MTLQPDEKMRAIKADLDRIPSHEIPRQAYRSLQKLTDFFAFPYQLKATRLMASKPPLPEWAVILDIVPDPRGLLCWLRLDGPAPGLEILYHMDPRKRTVTCLSSKAGNSPRMMRDELEEGMRALAAWERLALMTPERLIDDGWKLDWGRDIPIHAMPVPAWERTSKGSR